MENVMKYKIIKRKLNTIGDSFYIIEGMSNGVGYYMLKHIESAILYYEILREKQVLKEIYH